MIDPDVLKDFGALPFADKLFHSVQSRRACFQQWQATDDDIAGLSMGTVEHFGMVYMSRATQTNSDRNYDAFFPFHDFINTHVMEFQNVVKGFKRDETGEDAYETTTTSDIEAGSELISGYCNTCTNKRLGDTWGIYLEGNPNRLTREDFSSTGAESGLTYSDI